MAPESQILFCIELLSVTHESGEYTGFGGRRILDPLDEPRGV
jgi:hypothetical protein